MLNEVMSMATSQGCSALGPLLPGHWHPVWCPGTQYLRWGLGHVSKPNTYPETHTDTWTRH